MINEKTVILFTVVIGLMVMILIAAVGALFRSGRSSGGANWSYLLVRIVLMCFAVGYEHSRYSKHSNWNVDDGSSVSSGPKVTEFHWASTKP